MPRCRSCSGHPDGAQADVLRLHAGHGGMGDLGDRFVRCFLAALVDAEWPDDAEFRRTLEACIRWATDDVLAYAPAGAVVPDVGPLPRWGWDGLESAGGAPRIEDAPPAPSVRARPAEGCTS